MSEPPSQRPLDYANPTDGPRPPSGGVLVAAVICIIIGAILASIGSAAFATSLMQGWFEAPAFMFILVGGGLCAVGMVLKRGKPDR